MKAYERADESQEGELASDEEGVIRFQGRLCVPRMGDLKERIMEEAHRMPYTMHPGITKIY